MGVVTHSDVTHWIGEMMFFFKPWVSHSDQRHLGFWKPLIIILGWSSLTERILLLEAAPIGQYKLSTTHPILYRLFDSTWNHNLQKQHPAALKLTKWGQAHIKKMLTEVINQVRRGVNFSYKVFEYKHLIISHTLQSYSGFGENTMSLSWCTGNIFNVRPKC